MDLELLQTHLQTITKFGGYRAFQEAKDILREHGIVIECIQTYHYQITSPEELSDEVIELLRGLGVLGYGKEFSYQREYPNNGTHLVRAESKGVTNV
jgi:hypothetical protein